MSGGGRVGLHGPAGESGRPVISVSRREISNPHPFCGRGSFSVGRGFIDKDAGPLAELSLHSVCAYPPRCAARRGRTSLCLTGWVNRGVLFASGMHQFKLLMFSICGLWSKKGT